MGIYVVSGVGTVALPGMTFGPCDGYTFKEARDKCLAELAASPKPVNGVCPDGSMMTKHGTCRPTAAATTPQHLLSLIDTPPPAIVAIDEPADPPPMAAPTGASSRLGPIALVLAAGFLARKLFQ